MTWLVLGDSATGTSHRARNSPCQDAFRFCTYGAESEWLVVAVADGAGSSTHSEAGAKLVCDELVHRIEVGGSEQPFTRDGMIALFAEVRQSLIAEAERLDVPPREVACTALLAVVGPVSAAFAQLGDGAIVIGDNTAYRMVFWPEPAEYANATDFLTDDKFADVVQFDAVSHPVVEVAALTDGLQRLALDFTTRTPHPAFFQPLFNGLRTAASPDSLAAPFQSFLDSPRVNSRTDDDKTLVFAVRRS